jgi:hypothetical protein
MEAAQTAKPKRDKRPISWRSRNLGRAPKELDKTVFQGLCNIQCTELEICSVLRVSDKTLNSWCTRTYGVGFSEAYKIHSANGKRSLRRAQFDAALNGNPALLIWLGKQYLKQSDKVEQTTTHRVELIEAAFEDLRANDKFAVLPDDALRRIAAETFDVSEGELGTIG